jgi:hypothetical protein
MSNKKEGYKKPTRVYEEKEIIYYIDFGDGEPMFRIDSCGTILSGVDWCAECEGYIIPDRYYGYLNSQFGYSSIRCRCEVLPETNEREWKKYPTRAPVKHKVTVC